ncbi:iron ABC transporter permease [Abyssibacter sp.]|uniref:ABC transporter permease n=1 Tax=Abyssibacter sp. TaxID=2320200 RepID=UPI0025C5CFF2|nr:iron ABC transporter permease [Abyssibacter sp.]MCK5858752.1 iron ABC transporter permease [Abyssibacter sp.]
MAHRRRRRRLPAHPLALLIALPVAAALVTMLGALLRPDMEVWQFVGGTMLPQVVPTTLVLALATVLLATTIGVGCAWVTSLYDFPGRRWLTAALILPLAIPAYLLATVYIGWFDYAGPVASWLRDWFGPHAQLPPIRSVGGAALVLALALYPYVYLLARNAFLSQGRRALEVAASLGYGPVAGFLRIGLPLARPWIAGGALLVMMETLADFGAVSAFNVRTLTTAIYQSWFALFSIDGALALACVLVGIALVIATLERRQRRHQRFVGDAGIQATHRLALSGWRGWAASAGCGLVVIAGAIAPLAQLASWAWFHRADIDSRLIGFAGHSLLLAGMAAGLLTVVGLLLAWLLRQDGRRGTRMLGRLATAGYAIPGTVLAVALFVPLAGLSEWLSTTLSGWSSSTIRIALHAGLATLLLGYGARFLTVATHPIEGQLMRVSPAMEDVARSLGSSTWDMARRVHAPMIRGGLVTAAILVFVDVMKELPLTLMTRPYGWDTLAVRVFEMTAEGEWSRAAVPGVAIVLAGLIPVFWLVRGSEPHTRRHGAADNMTEWTDAHAA